VAAHLEPEILIIDEVLAVGDDEFQKKCLGKMEDVAGDGRTVLFVSHNMGAVQQLCPLSLLLADGTLDKIGNTAEIMQAYLSKTKVNNFLDLVESRIEGKGNQSIVLNSISIYGEGGKNSLVVTGIDFFIELRFINNKKNRSKLPQMDLRIDDQTNQRLLWFSTKMNNSVNFDKGNVIFRIPKCPLVSKEYLITVYINDGIEVANWYPQVMRFKVEEGDFYGNGLVIPQGQANLYCQFEVYAE
jgi:lipopolysaccharide transport system ATP-binding protein